MEGIDTLQHLIRKITDHIGDRPLDASLQAHMQDAFHYDGDVLYLLPQGQIEFTRH